MAFKVSFKPSWNYDKRKETFNFDTLSEAMVEFLGLIADNESATLKFKADKDK